MQSVRAEPRQLLVNAITANIIPFLEARGFDKLAQFRESRPNWDYHRPRAGGGFDLATISFGDTKRAAFYVALNKVGPQGLNQPWGETIEACRVNALQPLRRVLLLKKNSGTLAILLPKWFSHRWFGFRSATNSSVNLSRARTTCDELKQVWDQAEKWWADETLGPNLVSFDLGIKVNPAIVTATD